MTLSSKCLLPRRPRCALEIVVVDISKLENRSSLEGCNKDAVHLQALWMMYKHMYIHNLCAYMSYLSTAPNYSL